MRLFTVEINDYEPGEDPDPLTIASIEAAVQQVLDKDGSDGVVIVSEKETDVTPSTPRAEPHG